MKEKFLTVVLLLSLFSSLGFNSPVFVDCRDPEPDELLDLFGISNSITTLKAIPETQPAAFSGLIPDSYIFPRRHSWDLCFQPFISGPVSSVPLRC